MATWTTDDIPLRDALKAAIARGVLTVSFADRTITYNSLKEMRDLLADMERQINQVRTYRFAATSKGTNPVNGEG
jgi:hypothetical protein